MTVQSRQAAILVALAAFLAYASPASAKHVGESSGEGTEHRAAAEAPHTVTWWCVDLNELFHVDVPVAAPRGFLVAPPNPGIRTCSETSYPVTVPSGSAVVATPAVWFTNKTYSLPLRAVLEATGYAFVDASPMEDLLKKIVAVHVEVRTLVGRFLVASYTLDPRATFRRFQQRAMVGPLGAATGVVDPALGIDVSAEEEGRLPTVAFPGVVGPLPPGDYLAFTTWELSADHNDGLGAGPSNFIPRGASSLGAVRFVVVP